MKTRLLETLGLLALVALLWGLAAAVRREAPTAATSRTELARVQVQTYAALRQAAQDAERALARVQRFDAAPFSAPLAAEITACYVLRHDSLVYWSEHALLSEIDAGAETVPVRAIDTRRGKLLVVTRAVPGGLRAVAVVPLDTRYGISNRYLAPAPNRAIFGQLRPRLVIDERAVLPQVRAPDGAYLFSLAPDTVGAAGLTDPDTWLPLALLLTGVGFYTVAWARLARPVRRRWGSGAATAVALLPLIALRAGLLALNLPFALVEIPLFDPQYYAVAWWAPSLGDQLLNVGLLAVVAWRGLRWFQRNGERYTTLWRRRFPPLVRLAGALLMLAALTALIWYRYGLYLDTFANTSLDLDITQTVKLSWMKLLLTGLLVGQSAVAGVVLYVIIAVGADLLPGRYRGNAWRWLLAAEIGAWVAAFGLGSHAFTAVALALLFAKGVLVVRERQRARGVSYPQTVFLFAVVALWALVGALAQKRHYDRRLHAAESKLAASLLVEHDVLSEFLLEEVAGKMAADPLVARALTGPFAQPDIARQKITKYYLRDYFTQYETDIRFFDAAGREVGAPRPDTTRSLSQLYRRLGRTARPTEHPGLWLVGRAPSLMARRYVKLVRLPAVAGAVTPPTIALELSLKKLNPYSVVPELLLDQKYAPATGGTEGRPFSYAVFGAAGLVASEGEVDYSGWGPRAAIFRNPTFFGAGVSLADGFHHVGRAAGPGATLVVSSAAYTAGDVLSNFSFLFLLHLLATTAGVALVLGTAGRRRTPGRLQASLSTKIQVLLNLGTLVPLLVVSGATVAVSTSGYERDLVNTYQQRGARVQQNLVRAGRYAQARAAGRDALAELATDVADLSETDVLLYDPNGQLLTSSQPLLFETGALSKLLNPTAMAALRERGQPRALLPERAGVLDFNALYLPVPVAAAPGGAPGAVGTAGARPVAGFIGIPFFNSAQALDTKLTELVTTMMNIFTLMFIVFVLVAFIASRVLTAPLKLLAQKLKQTTLTGQNERLAYESPDEIGLLVGEYNQMLGKLEASRQELAARTQEAAWREMARQVAHEIKNPLTPMKLSLQYLQRVIHDGRQNVEGLIDKVAQTLITQIDTLADIASSFSSFTSLPEPRPERLELVGLLRQCLNLHPGTTHTPMTTVAREIWVRADRSLLVRTFNNLLLNALQAVPADRAPDVRATVEREGTARVRVGIHDNGTGIPEAVRPKVFVPNFSTKFSGSGIGLAVAKRAVEGAGGQLWFETVEGEGTVFYLVLPVVE